MTSAHLSNQEQRSVGSRRAISVTRNSQWERQFVQWLNKQGGPALQNVSTVGQLHTALSELNELAVERSFVDLGRGMVAGRLYYSRLGEQKARLALLRDDESVVKDLADVMLDFNTIQGLDEEYAEQMARHMASSDVDVLDQLYERAPSMFAQGMVLSWLGAQGPRELLNVSTQ